MSKQIKHHQVMTGRRADVLAAVKAAGPAGIRRIELAKHFGLSSPGISDYVTYLRSIGMVATHTAGAPPSITVTITPEGIAALRAGRLSDDAHARAKAALAARANPPKPTPHPNTAGPRTWHPFAMPAWTPGPPQAPARTGAGDAFRLLSRGMG